LSIIGTPLLLCEVEKKDKVYYPGSVWSLVAVVAQLVEHFHGKEKVAGSIPANGSV
jgi:hypothetical protein